MSEWKNGVSFFLLDPADDHDTEETEATPPKQAQSSGGNINFTVDGPGFHY